MIILLFSSINLVLGIALRLFWGFAPSGVVAPVVSAEPRSSAPSPAPPATKAEEPPAADAVTEDEPETVEMAVEAPQSIDLPPQWQELLGELGPANSLVEASAQVLRLEVGKYRAQLVKLEQLVRSMLGKMDFSQVASLLPNIRGINLDWLKRQEEATAFLEKNRGSMGDLDEMGSSLCDLLEDQAAQIETTCSSMEQLDLEGDPAAALTQLLKEVGRLIDMAHALRERMCESLTAILRQESRLETVERDLQFELPGQLNRTGLETLLYNWRRDNPTLDRNASLIMLDVDQMHLLNREHGTPIGDLLITALGNFFVDQLRKNRGYDHVSRLAGQRYVLFLGDTGPRGATSVAERIRQNLQAITFQLEETVITLSVSVAITELLPNDQSTTVLARLSRAVREAKREGRNCSYLDEGNGPEQVTPPEYDVAPRTIRLLAVE